MLVSHTHTLTHLLTNIKVPEVSPHQVERLSGPIHEGQENEDREAAMPSRFWVMFYSLVPDLARAGHAQLTDWGSLCTPEAGHSKKYHPANMTERSSFLSNLLQQLCNWSF